MLVQNAFNLMILSLIRYVAVYRAKRCYKQASYTMRTELNFIIIYAFY